MNNLIHSIEYKICSSIIDDPEDWITEINGEVFIFNEDDDSSLIAKCRHFFVDIDGSGYSADDLLDMRGETAPFISLYKESSVSFTDDNY